MSVQGMENELGTIKIFAKKASNKCFDILYYSKEAGQKLILYTDNGGKNQDFTLYRVDGSYYALKAEHSGLVLEVYRNEKAPGTQIIQNPFCGKDSQLFCLADNDDDTYTIISKSTGMVLELDKESTKDFTPIVLGYNNGKESQKFDIKWVKQNSELLNEYFK